MQTEYQPGANILGAGKAFLLSLSCLRNSQTVAQHQRCRVSGATGANAYTPTPHEWNRTSNQTTRQRNTLPDTSRNPSNHSRLLLPPGVSTVARVCRRGQVHLGTTQMVKDEELRSLLRKRGYRVLELFYDSYSDKKRDQLCEQILIDLRGK